MTLIVTLSYNYCSYALLWENMWLDLYMQIDSWIEDLESKMYEHAISWGGKEIYKEINRILEAEWIGACLNSELSVKEIKQISNWNLEPLNWKIKDECLKDWAISVNTLSSIQAQISKIDSIYSENAENRTRETFALSNIWLYSDWDRENSWFDLISDLDEINQVVFTSELKYQWEQVNWWDNFVDNFFKKKKNDFKKAVLWSTNNPPINQNPNNIIQTSNMQTCSKFNDNSWLNPERLNTLIRNLNEKNNTYTQATKKFESTWYKKTNDNWVFPCKTFFCININFKMYNHKLLWWSDSFSIESVLSRSNEHLKKFAWTFLWQSKMTTWNFELWLRDINLPDMFHMWFQISSKPVPILKLEKENTKEEKLFSWKNLLREYYKNNGIDYNRANDLEIYRKSDQEHKSINDSEELTPTSVTEKERERKNEEDLQERRNNLVDKAINKNILHEDMENFYEQFEELELFTRSMLDYTDNLRSIILQMRKIPSHN
jgi:hypothetical protein